MSEPLILQSIKGAAESYEKIKDGLPLEIGKRDFIIIATILSANLSMLDTVFSAMYPGSSGGSNS